MAGHTKLSSFNGTMLYGTYNGSSTYRPINIAKTYFLSTFPLTLCVPADLPSKVLDCELVILGFVCPKSLRGIAKWLSVF